MFEAGKNRPRPRHMIQSTSRQLYRQQADMQDDEARHDIGDRQVDIRHHLQPERRVRSRLPEISGQVDKPGAPDQLSPP